MEEKTDHNFWRIGFFGLLALLITGANIFAWYVFIKDKKTSPTPFLSPSPVATVISTPTPETLGPSPSPADETSLIKQAIFELTGLNETKAEVTINKNTGKHAKGNVKEFEAVGGAYWLAAKTEEGWIGVYAGQANPTCVQIAPYDFPKDMIPECLDASNNVVKR